MNDQATPKWKALNDQFDTVALEAPKPKEAQSEKQRLRISVPYLKTAVTMGAGVVAEGVYQDDQCQVLHYDGFGVTTEGHVHIEALGEKDKKTHIKIQTRGDLTLHSNESGINIGGKDAVLLGTEGGASMIGGGGVVIAGGLFGLTNLADDLQEPTRGENPATPKWVQTMGSVTSGIGAALDAIDLLVGRRRDAIEAQKSKENLTDVSLKAAKRADDLGGMVGDWMTGLGLAYPAIGGIGSALLDEGYASLVSAAGNIFGGTNVWGAAGLVLGTPVTMGIYSLLGTSIYSRTSVSVDSDNLLSLSSRKALSAVSEGMAEINAKENLFLVGGKIVHVASNDTLSLSGQRHAVLASPEKTVVAGGKTLLLHAKTVVAKADDYRVQATSAHVHGSDGAFLSSTKGDVGLVTESGVAVVSGSKSAALLAGNAAATLEKDKISVTVKAKPPTFTDAKEAVAKEYDPLIERKARDHSVACHLGYIEGQRKALEEIIKLTEERDAKIKEWDDLAASVAANPDDGVEITPGKVVIAAGGTKIKLSSSDCKIGDALKVSS